MFLSFFRGRITRQASTERRTTQTTISSRDNAGIARDGSEISNLTWSHVDRKQGIVRLEAGETKNKEGRTVYFDNEIQGVIDAQWEARKKAKKLTPYVFTNQDGSDKIKEFRKSWGTACKRAKTGDRLFHDLRRTAVRNMVRANIPERVAMMISGHKTRSVFERYNIVSADDLKLAASTQEMYLNAQDSYKTVTSANFWSKKGASQSG